VLGVASSLRQGKDEGLWQEKLTNIIGTVKQEIALNSKQCEMAGLPLLEYRPFFLR